VADRVMGIVTCAHSEVKRFWHGKRLGDWVRGRRGERKLVTAASALMKSNPHKMGNHPLHSHSELHILGSRVSCESHESKDGGACTLTTVTSEEVRDGLGELINRIKYGHERIKVTRRGKPVAALVTVEDFEFLEQVLEAIDDERDLPTIRERLRRFEETGEGISWDKIKAECGL
jgi:prevent-host-death family protein